MIFAGLIYLALAVQAQTLPPGNTPTLPPGEGKEIVQQKCGGCHKLNVVTSKRASQPQWSTLVDQMVTRGADIEDDDIPTVIDYLVKNFGPDAPPPFDATGPVNVNTATAPQLTAALGISPKESASIVSYRNKKGHFKQWRDLAKVHGIEVKKIEMNKSRLVF